MRRDLSSAILCLALAAALTGCAALLDRMRQHTYPPSFDYISEDQLKSVMWQMARDSKQIDKLVHTPGGPNEDQRQEIARLLGFMLKASKQLGTERTNHPLVDDHRADFQADLENARRGVLSNPPRYTLAENIAGACVRCHEHGTR